MEYFGEGDRGSRVCSDTPRMSKKMMRGAPGGVPAFGGHSM